MRPARISALALALVASAASFADTAVVRLVPGSDASKVSARAGVRLLGTTASGRYARLDLGTGSQVAPRLRALRRARGISVAEREVRFAAAQIRSAFPTTLRKGGVIPVVGGRAFYQAANADLLATINWDRSLAEAPGREIRVAILDTGLAEAAGGLWAKTDASRNFVEPGESPIDRPMGVDTRGDGVPDQAVGHGTLVAGVVDMVSPQSRLVVARIADSDGVATSWTLIQGLEFALEQGAEVVNVSLASRRRSGLVDEALQSVEAAGAIVVAAAGNDGAHDVYYPADAATVLGVAGLDLDGNRASFSNWHATVDLCAPAISVIGPDWSGETVNWSGTSFSSAFVAGSVADALRRTAPQSPRAVRAAIIGNGRSSATYRTGLGVVLDFQSLSVALGRGRERPGFRPKF